MKKMIFAIMAVLLLAIGGCTAQTQVEQPSSGQTDDGKTKSHHKTNISTSLDTGIVDKQQKLASSIKEASKGKTFDDPYVKLDPFGNAPLSAIIIFDTKEPAQASFTVKGKEKAVDIQKTMDGYKTHHELPVLGLYADKKNEVTLSIKTKSGATKHKTVYIKTDKLPDYTPTVTIEKIKPDQMEHPKNGLTFAVPSTKYPVGFDQNGDIRWTSSRYNSHVFKILDNGHLLFLSKDDNSGPAYNRLLEMDFMGRVYKAYEISANTAATQTGDGGEKTVVHHDAIELPSGNLLLTVNDGMGKYVEDTMIEIDRETGEIKKTINMKDILPESFYKDFDGPKREDGLIDWLHQNAVVYDPDDDSIIISSRNQDLIMKLDYKTENIKWIMAAHEGWPDSYKKYLVKGIGDDFKYTAGQHAPIILPESVTDGDEDTIDILLFDNNVVVTRGNEELSKQFSAGSQYRINEKEKTAKRVWTYGEERGKALFSNIIGSDRFMKKTHNRLVDFGWLDSGKTSRIIEVTDTQPAEVVFEAKLSDFGHGAWAYRAERFSLYPDAWDFKDDLEKHK